ncbi:Uncharacterised protein [Enterobacter cloacae]|nr:Uncharacterised protein [Enterobacter cloacae]
MTFQPGEQVANNSSLIHILSSSLKLPQVPVYRLADNSIF